MWALNHGMENQFRIDISLYLAMAQNQCWLKNKNITLFLQGGIELLIGCDVPNKQKCFGHTIFVTEIVSEAFEVKPSSLIPDGKVYILAVNESIIIVFLVWHTVFSTLHAFYDEFLDLARLNE